MVTWRMSGRDIRKMYLLICETRNDAISVFLKKRNGVISYLKHVRMLMGKLRHIHLSATVCTERKN